MTADNIRDREELQEQIRALGELKMMAETYGFDISNPATNTQEAIQWMYFAYLAAVKEQNGAAMSIGRTSTFIDIYAERDLANGTFTEEQIQEFVDHFIMKLRMVKFARTPEYQALFTGDPQWVTESIGGMGVDGRTLVTKMSYRYLHTLENMGTSPEPNMTVLWSTRLPENFKKFCAKTSVASSSIQYENDDLMRVYHGDDYGIACCVSSMRIGKEMQFFGARANLAKCLLYALNGGVDEVSKKQVGPKYRAVEGDTLDYDDVVAKYNDMMKWLAGVYVNSLNIIHYMHDKYCYERIQMALHDKHVHRWFATGIAGLSVVADSLSAIKYAKVHPVRDENGIIVDFETEGEFPKYGNDDDRVSLDLAISVDGWVADSAVSFVVGKDPDPEDLRIIKCTEEALAAAIDVAKPGNRLGDISNTIGDVAREYGYPINLEFGGHGVGHIMHGDPHVPNDGRAHHGYKLREGLVIAIEPWFLKTTDEIFQDPKDGWTLRASDGSRGAHSEHTIAITENGPIVFTDRTNL